MSDLVKESGGLVNGEVKDLISRQALKDLGAECIAKRDENGNLIPLGSIDSLPSVNPQKTGQWIADPPFMAKCSLCGYIQTTNGADKTGKACIHKAIYKYCPNCGAKMQEE